MSAQAIIADFSSRFLLDDHRFPLPCVAGAKPGSNESVRPRPRYPRRDFRETRREDVTQVTTARRTFPVRPSRGTCSPATRGAPRRPPTSTIGGTVPMAELRSPRAGCAHAPERFSLPPRSACSSACAARRLCGSSSWARSTPASCRRDRHAAHGRRLRVHVELPHARRWSCTARCCDAAGRRSPAAPTKCGT